MLQLSLPIQEGVQQHSLLVPHHNIQLHDNLYVKLKGLCDYHRIKLFWVPAKYATTMNVEGMDIYNQVMLPKAKEKALAAK
ncbi:hypothetical protein ACFQDF_27040 [Ectobacillus funiculus]